MLEKPKLDESALAAILQSAYGLAVESLTFLPLGADLNTAVYKAKTTDSLYFLKLRLGDFEPASVAIPAYLQSLGMKQIISVLPTVTGALWADMEAYKIILYPYLEGVNGFQTDLSDRHRIEFGTALKRFHQTKFPPAMTAAIPREQFDPQWRKRVTQLLLDAATATNQDPLASELTTFLIENNHVISGIAARAEQLATELQRNPLPYILCHGDIHGWNLFITEQNMLYIVDWDTLIFAPKERDLMFIGCGLGGRGHSMTDEARLFYSGYGTPTINQTALAYYRYERIIADVASFCHSILTTEGNGENRRWELATLKGIFQAGGDVDFAFHTDQTK